MADIKCPIQEAGSVSAEKTAIIEGDLQILFGELDMMVSLTAERLQEAGCMPGDRVAFFMNNEWRMVVAILAVMRLGAVACPISTRFPADGIRDALTGLNCKLLIARIRGAGVEKLINIQIMNPDDLVFHTVMSPGPARDFRHHLRQPATIVFTSGSSDKPKGVVHSWGNHYYSSRGTNIGLRLRSGDRWLMSLPLYHVGGLEIIFRCLLSGASMVLPEGDETILQAISHYGLTHLSLVPAQLRDLLAEAQDEDDLSSLRAVLLGGESVSRDLLKQSRARALPIFHTYGLTEMTAQVTSVQPDHTLAMRETSGQPLKHRELKVAADGEILVRGPTLCLGYVEGDEIVLPLDSEGWFETGDLGELNGDGCLVVLGRKDNMFISGGENIQPEEIEKALRNLPGVEQAVVVPMDDEKFGKRPLAFVKFSGDSIESSVLSQQLQDALPKFKIPDAWRDWPDDLVMPGQKLDRALFLSMV